MSGKALNHPVVRVTTEEKHMVEDDVMACDLYTAVTMDLPIPLAGKATHGDVDIIVGEETWPGTFPDKVREHASRKGFAHAAWPIPGREEECVQVDFIKVPGEYVSQATQYYSHGTLGNHIGLLCKSIGLRYGYQGLYVKVKDPANGQYVGRVEISRNPSAIFCMLGLSLSQSARMRIMPYSTREDSYKALRQFPWYRPEAFLEENMNASNRAREKKRPETANLRMWAFTRSGFDGLWEEAFRRFAGEEVYCAIWQKILLGSVMYNWITDKAAGLIEESRRVARAEKPMDAWFRHVAELTGLSGRGLSEFAMNLSKVLGCRITDLPNRTK